MDFRFTPAQQAFRQDVRAFLADALERVRDEVRPHQYTRFSPAFSRLLAERNWLALSWPKEFGGEGLGFIEQMIFNEELANAFAPIEFHRRAIYYAGPVLMRHGTPEQLGRFLEPIRRGEASFCQLFSEPNAGSDLASLQTTAIRQPNRDREGAEGGLATAAAVGTPPDRYVINGQKIWTSGGHVHDYGILLARTDPSAPKHRGISMFFLPMATPGVTVSPLINMAGRHGFNQVFLEDVVLGREWLIGEENQGWYQSRTLLEFERSSIAANSAARRNLDELRGALRRNWRSDDPGYAPLRGAIAEIAVRVEVAKTLSYAVSYRQAAGLEAGGIAAMVKLLNSELVQQIAHLGARCERLYGQALAPNDLDRPDWPLRIAESPSATVGGGTSEIQRNVMGLRYLDLPRGT